MARALAFSNNDIAVFAWVYDTKLEGCLGFAVYRGDVHAGTWEPLPALARFAATPAEDKLTTEQSPVQKFWWKDLGARRGGLFRYRIVPLGGTPGALKPLAGVEPLVTNVVALTHDRGLFKVFFNRGIVASQAVTRALGTPSAPKLLRHVAAPTDPLRAMLVGELEQGLELLLDRADKTDGEIRGALYELNDPKGLEVRLQAHDHGDPSSRAVILGNARKSEGKGDERTDIADGDEQNREALKAAGVQVIDRILPKDHIPHNKFLLLKSDGAPQAVLTGSTNWTMTGLCTQTNNALLIESPRVAEHYQAYWEQLERDSAQGAQEGTWQGEDLRTWNREHNKRSVDEPIVLEDKSATVEVMFAPSTKGPLKSKNPEKPGDMERVFSLIHKAKHAVLFLAFDPGNHSILDAAGEALRDNPKLFVRGALTSAPRAANFANALHVTVVGEPASGAKGKVEPDYRAIPASAVSKEDAFGAWEGELAKAGFAIIHDKIVVIDPFSDDCVVVTGSHNQGYRASSNNDENFVIVRGHRALAEAYACHVLDVYDHYAWRYWLRKDPSTFGRPLAESDDWQDRYLRAGKPSSPELAFWLSAVPSGDVHVTAEPHDSAFRRSPKPSPSRPTPGRVPRRSRRPSP